MGLMSFLKGLFGGNRDAIDVDDPQFELPESSASVQAQHHAQPQQRVPSPAPTPAPAPVTTPTFRLATRYPTTIDFPAVLRRAGVDADSQERVTKAQDLLRSLPKDSPAAVKRMIVEAAFTAFNVPTQKIIDAAVTEVAALEAFIDEGGATAQQVVDEGAARIAELDAEIAEIRASMEAALADQAVRDAATYAQIASVKPIIDFFGQDQGQPVHVQPVQPVQSQPYPAPPFTGGGPRLDFFSPPAQSNPLSDAGDDVDFD